MVNGRGGEGIARGNSCCLGALKQAPGHLTAGVKGMIMTRITGKSYIFWPREGHGELGK